MGKLIRTRIITVMTMNHQKEGHQLLLCEKLKWILLLDVCQSLQSQKKEPERDLQEVFRELRYGNVKPKEAPPDPFSPTFWNEVFKDPNETVENKLEQEVIEPREDFDFTRLPSVPIFENELHEKTRDTFSRPITIMLDGETIEITPKAQISEEKQISDTLQQLFPDVEKIAEVNKKSRCTT